MRATRRAKLAALAVAALAVPTGLVVGPAGTASAAGVTCNSFKSYYGADVPYYTGTGSVDCYMGQGASSDAVWGLQFTMNYCYGEHLTVDGNFGALTRAALIRTQQKAGTPADGEYGPNTRKAILHDVTSPGTGCIRVP
ncbi:peptidoglycan-binding domain-containing protein [Kitasatospora sp. NPDC002551]|uniref:peptidoglycan-binding domain-containing protein n=1 Tax=unclassified Kitasatospora TaxID=2633591 RepID=UPI003319ED72